MQNKPTKSSFSLALPGYLFESKKLVDTNSKKYTLHKIFMSNFDSTSPQSNHSSLNTYSFTLSPIKFIASTSKLIEINIRIYLESKG